MPEKKIRKPKKPRVPWPKKPPPAPPATVEENLAAATAIIENAHLEQASALLTEVAVTLKPKSGWEKIKAAGKKAVMLALTPAEYERFKFEAEKDRRAISAWIVYAALKYVDYTRSVS